MRIKAIQRIEIDVAVKNITQFHELYPAATITHINNKSALHVCEGCECAISDGDECRVTGELVSENFPKWCPLNTGKQPSCVMTTPEAAEDLLKTILEKQGEWVCPGPPTADDYKNYLIRMIYELFAHACPKKRDGDQYYFDHRKIGILEEVQFFLIDQGLVSENQCIRKRKH